MTQQDLSVYTTSELVILAQSGDRDAMNALVEQFQGPVLAIAFRRLGNWDEAQELSQDVFIQAFRRIHQLQVPDAFAGWLRQIVHRMAINRLTRRRVPVSVEQETLEGFQSLEGDDPSARVMAQETRQQLQAGLARLGDVDRDTLVAFYLQGQSLIEMSDAFSAPIGTIKRRLHVARKRLAREVELLEAV